MTGEGISQRGSRRKYHFQQGLIIVKKEGLMYVSKTKAIYRKVCLED